MIKLISNRFFEAKIFMEVIHPIQPFMTNGYWILFWIDRERRRKVGMLAEVSLRISSRFSHALTFVNNLSLFI